MSQKGLYVLAIAAALLSCTQNRGRYLQISGYAQGGSYSVKLNTKAVNVPVETLRDSIDALLLEIDTTLSGYNGKSLLSRFNAGETIRPNAMFIEIYSIGYELWERSGGALDFAAGPLFDAWGFGFKKGSMPSDKELKDILETCGMARLPRELPLKDGLLNPADMGNPVLNFNAVAQGYSCDRIAAYLYASGVKDMLVDIGEIWCDGLSPSGKPWAVGLDRPADRNPDGEALGEDIQGIWHSGGKPCGIVTSGNYRKYYIRDGRKYAHTIDPRTGYPVQHNLLSATVVSSASAADADAAATWCMVVGLEEARALVLGDSSLEACLTWEDEDSSMQQWFSPGFTEVTQ